MMNVVYRNSVFLVLLASVALTSMQSESLFAWRIHHQA